MRLSNSQISVEASSSELLSSLRYVNPLATSFVAPGKLPWIPVNESQSIDELEKRFHSLGRRVQVIGVHGSGKSTCLEHLVPRLGRVWLREGPSTHLDSNHVPLFPKHDPSAVVWFGLRRGSAVNDSLSRFLKSTKHFSGILVVDGMEQLNWWQRRGLKQWAQQRECGLVATSHRNLGLPTLLRTEPSLSLLHEIVREAWYSASRHGNPPAPPAENGWSTLYQRHGGDLRECLMELYDLAELEMRKVVREWPQS